MAPLRFATTFVLLSAGAGQAQTEIVIDRSPEACAMETSDTQIGLTDSYVSFWESFCDITGQSTPAAGVRDLSLSCQAEGETWARVLRIEETASGYRVSGDGYSEDYIRCN